MLSEILESFRPDEIVDDGQIAELKRWKTMDFTTLFDGESEVSELPVIVVCGCGRSGTTLTRVILDSHPELYSGPESLLFLPIQLDVTDLSYKFDLSLDSIKELLSNSADRVTFIEGFSKLVTERHQKKLWVDKTARNIHQLGFIFKHFPNATVVHVVRDPRDVVASLKTHKKRRMYGDMVTPTGYIMPVNLCIDRWEKAITDSLPFRSHPNYHEIHYEDLVSKPEQTIAGLCKTLGIRYYPQMVSFHEITSPSRDYKKFPQNIEATKPVSSSSVGRYKTVLTADEIDAVENRLSELMSMHGYGSKIACRTKCTLTGVLANRKDPPPIRVVPCEEVNSLLIDNPLLVKAWTKEVFAHHFQERFIQPRKTYLVTGDNPYDRIIALPASVGNDAIGIKWIELRR